MTFLETVLRALLAKAKQDMSMCENVSDLQHIKREYFAILNGLNRLVFDQRYMK